MAVQTDPGAKLRALEAHLHQKAQVEAETYVRYQTLDPGITLALYYRRTDGATDGEVLVAANRPSVDWTPAEVTEGQPPHLTLRV